MSNNSAKSTYYAVDETGTPMAKTGASSSQHSYLWQSRNPLSFLHGVLGEQIAGNPYDPNSKTSALKAAIGLPGAGGGSGGSGSGGSGSGGSGSPFSTNGGRVGFSDPNLQAAMEMMNQTAMANNFWSAEQAQKQMDFQERMSNTAHQREVQDLLAAGLNPVLSAGGQGAQAMSGAKAEADTSNTDGIIQLAMAALSAVSSTASSVSAAAGAGGKGFLSNYYVRRALGAAAGFFGGRVGSAAAGALLGSGSSRKW